MSEQDAIEAWLKDAENNGGYSAWHDIAAYREGRQSRQAEVTALSERIAELEGALREIAGMVGHVPGHAPSNPKHSIYSIAQAALAGKDAK